MPEQRDYLDEALDDALATYGLAPENDGLDQRIAARVAVRARRARSAKWLVGSIAAAVVVLVAFLFTWVVRKEVLDVPPTLSLWRGHSCLPCRDSLPHPGQLSKVRALNITGGHRARRKRTAEPKLSRFPAPSPLTNEERALVRLVASAARNPSLRLEPPGEPIKPIRITAIDIKPLAWGAVNKEK